MTYWWELLGWIGRAHYELQRMLSPYSTLLGRMVREGDFVSSSIEVDVTSSKPAYLLRWRN